jgi:3-phenylpropionate/trans-cinnamate dioxygenase ferredoxin reductase subunit
VHMPAAAPNGERLVVVGGGQAAAQAIEVARQHGYDGQITLVTDEPTLPYQRPPLSKQYLTGRFTSSWLLYRPNSFYAKFAVDVLPGRRATAIDRLTRVIALDDGSSLGYDKLLLTTGARARPLQVPGAEHPHIFYIRTLADVDGVRARIAESRRVIIIGGGFIGLETAAVLAQAGLEITLLAADKRLLPRVIAGEMAEFLLDHHLMHGINVVLNAAVVALHARDDGGIGVALLDGRSFESDLVLVGIGAIPNAELAEACGLLCDNGIMVDELARTSDPAIMAAGDCTNHPNGLIGRRLRLETVHNAVEQGRTAGATIAGGELPYIQTPWVWSDQYSLRLQSVGVAEGYDRTVMRGKPADGRFSLFYYREDEMLAVNCINQPMIFGAVRRLLNERIPLHADHAADTNFDLAQILPRTASFDFDIPWPTKLEKRQAALAWGFD